MFDIAIRIDRPVHEVFAYLTEIEEAPRWYSAVESVVPIDSGAAQLGARFRFTRKIAGSVVTNDVRISEFDPDRTLALESLSGPTPFSYRYRLSRDGDATLLHLEGEISGDGLGWPAAMFKGLAEGFFRRGMAANLQSLKGLLEAA